MFSPPAAAVVLLVKMPVKPMLPFEANVPSPFECGRVHETPHE